MCVCENRVHTIFSPIKRVYIHFQHSKNFKHLNKKDKQVYYLYSVIISLILSHSQQKLSHNETDSEKNNEEEYNR